MRCVAVIISFAFVTHSHAKELREAQVDQLADKLADRLSDRVTEAVSHHSADIDDTLLGKAMVQARPQSPLATSTLSGARVQMQMIPRGMGCRAAPRSPLVVNAASLQFIKGQDEPCVPEVKLSRSKGGDNGVATFIFDEPQVFDMGGASDEITGLYMVDDEGTLQTVDVQARFINGKPAGILAKYPMKSVDAWDRFMRFMEKYAEDNDLGFNAAKGR